METPKKYKQMSNEALLEEYARQGDLAVRNIILERFLYLAEIIAKKYSGRGVEYDDLFQIASMSLVGAIERFDLKKGVKFQSYATPTLIGEIKNYFRDKTRPIKIARKDSADIKKMDDCRCALEHEFNRVPRVMEIAEGMGISEERVLELMEAKAAGYTASYEGVIASANDFSLEKVIGDTDEAYELVEDRELLSYCFKHLNPLERRLIKARYIDQKSQSIVAKTLSVSQMQVSRLERKILLKMKDLLENNV